MGHPLRRGTFENDDLVAELSVGQREPGDAIANRIRGRVVDPDSGVLRKIGVDGQTVEAALTRRVRRDRADRCRERAVGDVHASGTGGDDEASVGEEPERPRVHDVLGVNRLLEAGGKLDGSDRRAEP